MTKPKFAYQIILGIFLSAFIIVACNNKKEEKKDGETKMDQPMKDTTKMDTGSTKPVQPGN